MSPGDLRHRIINIIDGEIVFDEVILGSGNELIPGSEPEQQSLIYTSEDEKNEFDNVPIDAETADSISRDLEQQNALATVDDMSTDDVIAAISGVSSQGGAQ